MVARRVMDEPEDAALRTLEASFLEIELDQRRGVTRLCRLLVRDIPVLRRGDLEELVPARGRAIGGYPRHAQTINPIKCLCKRECWAARAPGADEVQQMTPHRSLSLRKAVSSERVARG